MELMRDAKKAVRVCMSVWVQGRNRWFHLFIPVLQLYHTVRLQVFIELKNNSQVTRTFNPFKQRINWRQAPVLICGFSAVPVIVFAWNSFKPESEKPLELQNTQYLKPVANISDACIVLPLLQFWSNHLIWVLYYYCPNLHVAVLGFNVKYYKDSLVLMETESFMSVFYSLRSGLAAALFSPQPEGQWMLYSQSFSWWLCLQQFDPNPLDFERPVIVCGATTA